MTPISSNHDMKRWLMALAIVLLVGVSIVCVVLMPSGVTDTAKALPGQEGLPAPTFVPLSVSSNGTVVPPPPALRTRPAGRAQRDPRSKRRVPPQTTRAADFPVPRTPPAAGSPSEKVRLAAYRRELALVHELGDSLPKEKVTELCEVLVKNHPDDSALGPTEWNAIKNDLLDKLLAQKILPSDLGKLIVDMYRNRQTDPIWRDYCIQHIVLYWPARWPAGNAPVDDPDAVSMRSALWDAVEETGSTIAGTALLGLERLSQTDKGLDRAKIGNKAMIYATSGASSSKTRATALQVCVAMNLGQIVPTARTLVQDTQEDIPLRLSAAAALGRLGDSNDLPMLQSVMAAASDPLLRKAASTAVASIQAREANSNTQ